MLRKANSWRTQKKCNSVLCVVTRCDKNSLVAIKSFFFENKKSRKYLLKKNQLKERKTFAINSIFLRESTSVFFFCVRLISAGKVSWESQINHETKDKKFYNFLKAKSEREKIKAKKRSTHRNAIRIEQHSTKREKIAVQYGSEIRNRKAVKGTKGNFGLPWFAYKFRRFIGRSDNFNIFKYIKEEILINFQFWKRNTRFWRAITEFWGGNLSGRLIYDGHGMNIDEHFGEAAIWPVNKIIFSQGTLLG